MENICHLIGNQLRQDAINKNIVKETFQGFSKRVKQTILEFPSDVIDKTIASMPKRIDMVIKSNQNIFFILDEIIDVDYEEI